MSSAPAHFRKSVPDPQSLPSPDMLSRLVSEGQGGGGAAVNALLAALRPGLVAYYSRSMSLDAAEDLAQAALLRIHRALPRIEANRAHAFVWTVARNLRRSWDAQHARETRRRAPEHLAHMIGVAAPAERELGCEELARAVHRVAAAKLPPGQREVILGLLRDETSHEIAARLKISPTTVRTQLMRARAVLREELAGILGSPPDPVRTDI